MAHSEKIAEALNDILSSVDPSKLTKLALALQEFKETSRRSYDSVRRQPFAHNIIDAMEDAIGWQESVLELANEA